MNDKHNEGLLRDKRALFFWYDQEDQIKNVTTEGGSIVTYQYDGVGSI
jgi:hypothetical protein